MRRGLFSAVLALTLGACVLAAAGCGGGSKSEATTTADTSETETGARTGTTIKRGTAFLTAARCRQYQTLLGDFDTTLAGVGTTDTERAAEVFTLGAAHAPRDVAGNFQTLADAYTELTDVLDGVEPGQEPSPELIDKLEQLSQALEAKHVSQASTNVSFWLRDRCPG